MYYHICGRGRLPFKSQSFYEGSFNIMKSHPTIKSRREGGIIWNGQTKVRINKAKDICSWLMQYQKNTTWIQNSFGHIIKIDRDCVKSLLECILSQTRKHYRAEPYLTESCERCMRYTYWNAMAHFIVLCLVIRPLTRSKTRLLTWLWIKPRKFWNEIILFSC